MPSPTSKHPHIWTPRGSMRFFVYPRDMPVARPVPASPAVPLRGAFAGLSPRSLMGRRLASAPVLRMVPDELIAEAERLEAVVPTNLRELIGYVLAANEIDTAQQADAWDPTSSGSITRNEFRLRLRGVLQKHGHAGNEAAEIDEIFGSVDVDGSGIVGVTEVRQMLLELKEMGAELIDGAERRERLARAAKLRDVARLALDAKALLEQAASVQKTSDEAKVGLASDLEVQLGMACNRRRVRAADFVGEHASSSEGMTRSDFRTMAAALLPKSQVVFETPQLDTYFTRLDSDGSGALDLKEAANALVAMQRRAVARGHEQDAIVKRAQVCRKKAEGAVSTANDAWRASLQPSSPHGLRSSPTSPGSHGSPHAISSLLNGDDSGAGSSPTGAAERARRKRVKQTVTRAMGRLRTQHAMSLGFNSWLEFADRRRDNMSLVKHAVRAIVLRDSRMAMASWQAFSEREAEREALIRRLRSRMVVAVSRLDSSQLARAFALWRTPPGVTPGARLCVCVQVALKACLPASDSMRHRSHIAREDKLRDATMTVAGCAADLLAVEPYGPTLDEMRAALRSRRAAAASPSAPSSPSSPGSRASRVGSRPRLGYRGDERGVELDLP